MVEVILPSEEEILNRNLPGLVGFEFNYQGKKFHIKEILKNQLICEGSDGMTLKFSFRSMARLMRDRKRSRLNE